MEEILTLEELEKVYDEGNLPNEGWIKFYPTSDRKEKLSHWYSPLSEIHLQIKWNKERREAFNRILIWGK